MFRPTSQFALTLAALALSDASGLAQWNGHAGDPQHTAISAVPTLSLGGIRWSAPVDESNPSEPVLIHYGSPIITAANTIVVPVRQVGGSYRVDAHSASTGALLWGATTDYLNAPSNGSWVPSFSPTLTPSGALYYQGRGGTVYRVDNPNALSVARAASFLPDYAVTKRLRQHRLHQRPSPPTTRATSTLDTRASAARPAVSPAASRASHQRHRDPYIGQRRLRHRRRHGLRVGTNSAPALSNDGSKPTSRCKAPPTTSSPSTPPRSRRSSTSPSRTGKFTTPAPPRRPSGRTAMFTSACCASTTTFAA